MLSLCPTLREDLKTAGLAIAENITQVVEATVQASYQLKNDPAGSNQDLSQQARMQGVQDVGAGVVYLRDVCLSLCAMLRMLPSAAALLLAHSVDLIEALGAVHDQLVPHAEEMVRKMAGQSPSISGTIVHVQQLEMACEVATDALMRCACLDETLVEEEAGSGSGASGSGATATSSSSSFVHSSTSGKKKANVSMAATRRGETLLQALTQLGHRETSVPPPPPPLQASLSMAPALAQRHGFGALIQSAAHKGIIYLDEAQEDYVAALLGVASLSEAPSLILLPSHRIPTGEGAPVDTPYVPRSLVAQVKELLPDLGDGYIAMCLDAMNRHLETTIHALFEGSAPSEIGKLDQQLSYARYQEMYDERKMAAEEAKEEAESAAAFPPLLASPATAAAPKRGDDLTAKYLDAKESSYAEKVRAVAVESQWEYEDEYDDSFDDLLHIVVDGVVDEEEKGGHGKGGGGALHSTTQPRAPPTPGSHYTSTSTNTYRKKVTKYWILDGRMYNYPKPGAKEVESEAAAQDAIREAQHQALQIHGLGPGGNKPFHEGNGDGNGGGGEEGGRGGGGGGRGEGGRGRSRGRGRGRGDQTSNDGGTSNQQQQRWKDKNKSSVANHNRKERATQKMSRAM